MIECTDTTLSNSADTFAISECHADDVDIARNIPLSVTTSEADVDEDVYLTTLSDQFFDIRPEEHWCTLCTDKVRLLMCMCCIQHACVSCIKQHTLAQGMRCPFCNCNWVQFRFQDIFKPPRGIVPPQASSQLHASLSRAWKNTIARRGVSPQHLYQK